MNFVVPSGMLLLCGVLAAQQQSYDAFSYRAPGGYNSRDGNEMRELSRVDQQRKFYCQIVMYRAQPTLGSAQTDLENEWKAGVLNGFTVKGATSDRNLPLPQAPESMVRTAETTTKTGASSLSTLFVLRFPGRYVGILFNTSHQQAFEICQEDIAGLIASVQMSGVAPAVAPAMPGSVLGTWEHIAASQIPMTYNMFTKSWEYNYAAAGNQFRNVWRYTFEAGNRYTKELKGLDINRSQDTRFIEKGLYTVSGDILKLEAKECSQGRAARGQPVPLERCQPSAPYSFRFLLGPHPSNGADKTPGLQISEKEGSWTSYKPVR